MSERSPRLRILHRHRPVSAQVVVRRAGVPYVLERTVCGDCGRLLSEQSLGRTAA